MEKSIKYVEEETFEKVYQGTYILDGLRISEEEQKKKIFDMARNDGINIEDENSYEIRYMGSDDNEGISETQQTRFEIYRKVTKQVPYEITRNEVYEGTYILDGLRISEEEQKKKIFNMARSAGVEIKDEANYEISYMGATDDDGLSETQSTKFIIYEVEKKKINEEEAKLEDETLQTLKHNLEELKQYRERLQSTITSEERQTIIDEVLKKTNELESTIGESTYMSHSMQEELNTIEKQINGLQKDLKDVTKKYEKSYERMKKLIDEQNEKLSSSKLLSAEEIKELKEEYAKKKLEENKMSISIKNQIQTQRKLLTNLKRRKNKIQKDIENAEIYGLSVDEFKDIDSTLQKRSILNPILNKKGLEEIVQKKSSDRTKEEKQKIEEAKEEAIKEISNLKRFDEKISVLDAIDALYSAGLSTRLVEKPRPLLVDNRQYTAIKNKTDNIPEKIVNQTNNYNYKPGKAPEEFASINNKDITERINLYKDANNNYYVRRSLLSRFQIDAVGEEVRIDGAVFLPIDSRDAEYIKGNANNDFSPYEVVENEVVVERVNNPQEEVITPIVPKNNTATKKDEEIKPIVSEDTDTKPADNKEINPKEEDLISKPVENKEDIPKEDLIKKLVDDNKVVNPKEEQKPITKKEKQETKKVKPHVESILYKLTKDLDIHAKDAKRYTASNIKVAKSFARELQSGNYLYNIVHVIPAVIKLASNTLVKVSNKIFLTGRGKKAMEEVKRRLDEELTDEELDVLFNEYRGSQLKTDMNNQINSVILPKLREYGLNKVKLLNNDIKENYQSLFTNLGQIKALDNQLKNKSIDKLKKNSLEVEKKVFINQSATRIKEIIEARKEADRILSGGVHGLEEDFKAVSTKLSYVGMRFAKTKKFNNDLQELLAYYGEGLNAAIANDNSEAIVDNFMGLESCYYKNTSFSLSAFGKRSVGDKYYTPIAEQFDYRDDPFIRDIFTTVAITTAVVGAARAIEVHGVESQAILKRQQDEAFRVNQNNDNMIDFVHQAGRDIEGKRETFQKGMESQVHQDVLNQANALEREALDKNNWSFTDSYHTADQANHEIFNSFNQDVSQEISNIANRYAGGSINQAQALQEMSQVARYSQNTFVNTTNECLEILREYSQTHPQFDLSAVEESMQYISSNPEAIIKMNEAMVESVDLAGGLAGLDVAHVTALTSLPSDMITTLANSATSCILAGTVAATMKERYGKKNIYGNEITDMMDNYLAGEEQEEKNIKSR